VVARYLDTLGVRLKIASSIRRRAVAISQAHKEGKHNICVTRSHLTAGG
jgi:hypothetical protein